MSALGDCFVLLNSTGQWWTGDGWSAKMKEAQRFTDEPDPDRQARQAAAAIEARTAIRCHLVYVSRHQARTFFREGRPARSLRRAG